jgi:hypothetical protein
MMFSVSVTNITIHGDQFIFVCGEGKGVQRILVGRPEGRRPLGGRWEDNIKMNLREIGIDGTNWIRLAQDRVQWRAFANTVMNLWVP